MIPLPISEARDVELLIKAHHGVIAVNGVDEQRADRLFEHVAQTLQLPYFVWRSGTGLLQTGLSLQPVPGTQELVSCLRHIAAAKLPALYQVDGLEAYQSEPLVLSLMKQIAAAFMHSQACFLLKGAQVVLPAELQPYAALVKLKDPTPREYYAYIRYLYQTVAARSPLRLKLNAASLRKLVRAVQGLSYLELHKALSRCLLSEGALNARAFEYIQEAKRGAVERGHVLEYCTSNERLEDLAGLGQLKSWLNQRSVVFHDSERAEAFGLTAPRGLLLLGVQGCGKSMCAKAVASAWGIPLLRFDPARIYDRYVGQTERNLALAMRLAEQVAPVVLWIDELEKVFAPDADDSGVSTRLLGSFLQWLQEKKNTVFVVATANDASRLPPELLRKGRFDEIFFVDLPDQAARRAIVAIQLSRRKREPEDFRLDEIAQVSAGFSGAELEQAILGALYACFASQQPLSTEAILEEVRRTKPLSVTMAESVARLRAWAKERAVPAD